MVLLHLPRTHISLSTHFSLFPKPKTPAFATATTLPPILTSALFSAPKSTLSASEPIPISELPEPQIEPPQEFETHIEIPLEKLFVPPETEVSYTDAGALSTRILKGSNILLSKYARNAQVEQAEFVKSSVRTEDCPSDGLPEFALVGRSNVGKSSLLNSLVRRKRLALTSKKPGQKFVLKYARNAQVEQAEFVKSSVRTEDCPSDGLPEFALVGRSNVGKSSLLNSLVRRKRLALTSKKPGKTQCINHFRINDSWYLVDLPGYLCAPLISCKPIEIIPMTLIFTKCDKRKKKRHGGKKAEENVQDFQELISGFFETVPPWIMTSSLTNQGRDEMLLHMAQLRNYWLKH
ncbi:hypothetical protein C1H46_011761 [Malus baccata]|uniref:G domain-containing protein n=1 Tax=Malus baccata TaxID=106549 RepID=A0A540MUW4_MALBA|nr:hypothetical protein C1H46_011761 [Malus baccata]